MKTAIKTTLAVVASAAAIASVATIPSIVSAWGDNSESGHRSTYSLQYINEHAEEFGKTPFFNSIRLTGSREDQDKERVESSSDYWWYPQTHKDSEGKPIYLQEGLVSDETDFVGIREDTGVDAGPKNVWHNDIKAEDGKTYIIRLYVHNNNPYGEEAVAENTRVRFSFPTSSSRNAQVLGFITSDANPSSYHDYANFYSETNSFHLEYVEGSALFESQGAAGGSRLDDKVANDPTATGVLIGYDALDGRIPGCYSYTSYTTIKVKVVFDREFNIETKVRVVGDSDKTYKAAVNANIGDTVEYQIEYNNTSDKTQNHVAIRDILPTNMKYVEGSTKLYNTNYPTGVKIDQDNIVDNGIYIGNYESGANAFIRFRAVVTDVNLACGSNALVNWGQGQADASTQIILQDKATVYTVKVCSKNDPEPTNPVEQLPNTGPEAIAGGIIAAGSIATAAGYYIASRRQLR